MIKKFDRFVFSFKQNDDLTPVECLETPTLIIAMTKASWLFMADLVPML
jgi:hypothetical protein